uniref:Uncharacterized protein n=1 Tax=Nelumbo nucifera TaxID=4432 RepID=A0A822YUC2_NELNU|nr:TPA_asm: hypothetical protein HUJ06_004996 [Nelumbo nucifera]
MKWSLGLQLPNSDSTGNTNLH